MASLFGKFDKVRVINLPQRLDRRRAMEREFSKVGLTSGKYDFFPAIRPAHKGDFTSIGARGCYESHLSILREACSAQHSILIMEDDCAFAIDLARNPFAGNWEMFYGGYYASNPSDLHSSDIIGSHMMGFSATGARRVVQYLEKLAYEGIHPPIDAAYVWFRRAHPEIRTEFAIPPLAFQRPSRSDIAELKIYDRIPLVRNLVNALRASWPSKSL